MFRLYSEIEFLQQIKAGYLILEHMEDWILNANKLITEIVCYYWQTSVESFMAEEVLNTEKE